MFGRFRKILRNFLTILENVCEKSGYILPMDEILIHKHFPKAKFETISKAGHWLHADNPSQFYDKIMEFLK